MLDSLDPFDCDGIWDACLSLWPFNSHPLQTHITRGIPADSVLISFPHPPPGVLLLLFRLWVVNEEKMYRPSCQSEIDSIKMWKKLSRACAYLTSSGAVLPRLNGTHPIYLIPASDGPLLVWETDYKLQGSAPRDKWQHSPHPAWTAWQTAIPCRCLTPAARRCPLEKTIKVEEV